MKRIQGSCPVVWRPPAAYPFPDRETSVDNYVFHDPNVHNSNTYEDGILAGHSGTALYCEGRPHSKWPLLAGSSLFLLNRKFVFDQTERTIQFSSRAGPFQKCRVGQDSGKKIHDDAVNQLLLTGLIFLNLSRCKLSINIFTQRLPLLMEIRII